MALNCLDGIVGVKGCGVTPATLYVQQLPGISIPDIDVAISTDHVNAKAFLESKIDFALQYVLNDVRQHLGLKYSLKTFIENDTIGAWNEESEIDASEAGYLTGVRLRIDNMAFLKLFVNRVALFVDYTGDVELFVYDLTQNKLLNTITVNAVAGEIVYADVNLEYFTQRQRMNLFIGYVSSFDSYQTQLSSSDNCGGCGNYQNGYIYWQGAKILNGADKVVQNIESNTGTSGIVLEYSLGCSFEEHLCNVRNMLAMPILYKCGALIMQELKVSKRPNPVVSAYKGDNDALMAYYDLEYSKQMKDLLRNMNMPESVCFSCSPQMKSVVTLP